PGREALLVQRLTKLRLAALIQRPPAPELPLRGPGELADRRTLARSSPKPSFGIGPSSRRDLRNTRTAGPVSPPRPELRLQALPCRAAWADMDTRRTNPRLR